MFCLKITSNWIKLCQKNGNLILVLPNNLIQQRSIIKFHEEFLLIVLLEKAVYRPKRRYEKLTLCGY